MANATRQEALPRPTFYCLIPDAPPPQRATRDAMGRLPVRAARYCDAATLASGFGWWLFPPMDFRVVRHGDAILWSYGDRRDWFALTAAQFPHFSATFDRFATPDLQGCSPPFLTALPEPGMVQVWTGHFVRCAPGWSLHMRAPANMPPQGAYRAYEGIVEADAYFAPVFANLALTRSDEPVHFSRTLPLIQLQPVPRAAFTPEALSSATTVEGLAGLDEADWADYRKMAHRRQGAAAYAIDARRRRKHECPMTAH